MSVLTVEEIIAVRSPLYATDPRIPTLLILAEDLMGDKIPVGNVLNLAYALQILHWMTLDDRAKDGEAPVGAISEEKEGELTQKYSKAGANVLQYTSSIKADYGQTKWGTELWALIKRYLLTVYTRFA